jgi:hypothetical protein
MRPYLRYLKIGWTVLCGLACILLIALWVRSYWRHDYLYHLNKTVDYIGIESDAGIISFTRLDLQVYPRSTQQMAEGWTHDILPLNSSSSNPKKFQMDHTSGFLLVVFPNWSLIIPLAALAAAPWIRRFSLRTLLVATTLVALVLGVTIWLK